MMARAGLPATLISGSGTGLREVLVRSPEIGAMVFVGGRSSGGKIAVKLADTGKRHMVEQEGLSASGIWDFSCSRSRCASTSRAHAAIVPKRSVAAARH